MPILSLDYGLRDQHRTHRDLSRGEPPQVSVAATDLPCSLEDVRLACRIDDSFEDPIVSVYLNAAIAAVENDAEIALMPQTMIQYLDDFPAGRTADDYYHWGIELRRPPITAVTGITYYDFNGVQQTVDTSVYIVDTSSRPGLILPAYGQVWPPARKQLRSIAVTFTCGYASASLVPANALLAIYQRVAAAFWDRETNAADIDAYWNLLRRIRWREF